MSGQKTHVKHFPVTHDDPTHASQQAWKEALGWVNDKGLDDEAEFSEWCVPKEVGGWYTAQVTVRWRGPSEEDL